VNDILAKIVKLVKKYEQSVFLGVCIILIIIIGYNIGRISSTKDREAAQINSYQIEDRVTPTPIDKRVVASKKSSSRLYHFTWCSGAKSIKEENKLWFSSEEEAIGAGYKLSGNCRK